MPEEIKEAEVNQETHDAVTVFLAEDQLADVQVSRQSAVYIRVTGEKTGCYYTQDPHEDALEALKKAYANSLYGERAAEKIRTEKIQSDFGEQKASGDIQKLTAAARSLVDRALSQIPVLKASLHAEASLKAETYGQHTVNSHGVDVSCCRPVYIFSLTVSVTCDGYTVSADTALAAMDTEFMDAEQAGREIWLKCRAQIDPQTSFTAGEYPAILSNSVVYYLFGTAWQLFSGCKYAEGTSKLAGMLGEKIASSCLEIQDLTDCGGRGFPMYCDSEGNEGRDTVIVKDGRLMHLLHNISSAAATGQDITGNAGRRPLLYGNIATDIQVTPKNICILPGQADMEALKAHTGDGILVTESFDIFHTIDISSGDFSIPCRCIRIENGKETKHLVSLTMTGNMCELLQRIEEVGNTAMLHPMVALENYGIGTCPLRLSGVHFSGE